MKKTKFLIILSSALLVGTNVFAAIPEPSATNTINSQSLIEVAKAFTRAGSSSFQNSVSELLDELTVKGISCQDGEIVRSWSNWKHGTYAIDKPFRYRQLMFLCSATTSLRSMMITVFLDLFQKMPL